MLIVRRAGWVLASEFLHGVLRDLVFGIRVESVSRKRCADVFREEAHNALALYSGSSPIPIDHHKLSLPCHVHLC